MATLLSIAPEVEVALLRDNRPLRLQVDLDSIDELACLRARLPQASPDPSPESD